MRVRYSKFIHRLSQEKTVQQKVVLVCTPWEPRGAAAGMRQCPKLYCVCLCHRSNRSISQDMNLPFWKAKIMHEATLKKAHLCTISLAKPLCFGNFLQ